MMTVGKNSSEVADMTRSEIPFIDLLRESWPFLTGNLLVTLGVPATLLVVLAAAGFVASAIGVITGVLVGFVLGKGLVLFATVASGTIVGVPLVMVGYGGVRAGWTKIMLDTMRGKRCSFSDIKRGMPFLLNFALTMFIVGVGTGVGLLFLLVPGVFFMVRTCFAPFLVIDENLDPIEAIKQSNELVSGYSWQILAYQAIYWFANLVAGMTVPFILPVASMGFFDLALARIYLYRKGEEVELPAA
jgi:hypothetical protein